MGPGICLSHNVYCEGPSTASGDIVPKKELVSGEGVHKIKERTYIKEGFQLEK